MVVRECRWFIFITLGILSMQVSYAQSDIPAVYDLGRPKIGLVLSGGGAKGMAHIGVLKVLEEVGIRPDYIAGTSMGGLVGGLYSIGYSAYELDSIATNIDWSDMLSDNVSLYEVGIEEKAYFNNYVTEFTFDEEKGLGLPSGLIQGQKVQTKFASLTWSTAGINAFDDFPIPFRCVATDLLSGQPVVFEKGDLVTAMRASMSIPSAFAPVHIDTMLLVDGGVTRNYPVEDVIRMGADIVIGVYVGTKRGIQENELQSLTDILGHTGFLGGVKDSESQMKLVDIEILPDMSHYGSDNFSKAQEIISQGEKAARKKIHVLEGLANSQSAYPPPIIKKLPINDSLKFEQILFSGNTNIETELIADLANLKSGTYYSYGDINKAIESLYGTGYFDKIAYELPSGDNGGYNLKIVFKEKTKGSIKFAVKYDSYFGPGVIFNLSLKSTVLRNDKLFAPIEIAPSPKAKIEYQKSMNNFKKMAIAATAQFEANEIPFYTKSDTLSIKIGKMFQTYIRGGAGLVLNSNTRNRLSAMWLWNMCRQSYKDGLDRQLKLRYQQFENYKIEAKYLYNSFDRHYFPNKGRKITISATSTFKPFQNTYFLADSTIKQIEIPTYNQIFFDYCSVFSIGYLRVMPHFAGAYTWGLPQNMDYYFLGGDRYTSRIHTLPFYGFQPYALSSHRFYLVGLELFQEVANNTFLMGGVNYARLFDEVNQENIQNFRSDYEAGVMVGIGMLTKLGPLWMKWSQEPKGLGNLLINIGFQL